MFPCNESDYDEDDDDDNYKEEGHDDCGNDYDEDEEDGNLVTTMPLIAKMTTMG